MDLQIFFFVWWKTIELNSSINRNQGDKYNRNQGDIVIWKIQCHAPWRISDRALRLSHHILRQHPQEIRRWGASSGQALVPQVRHPDCFRARPTRGPMPVPTDDTNANAVEPPADAAAAAPALPPAPAAEAAALPEKPALPTPPANKGRGGNQTGGRAIRSWLKYAWDCISVIRCCSLQYSAVGREDLQRRIQPQGSIPRLNRKDQYMPVRTSLYDLNDSRTALCLHLPPYTIVCAILYHLGPSCTTLYHIVLCRYKAVHTGMYLFVLPWKFSMSVRTGMYHFEVSRIALYRVRYVLARTSTYHLVLPFTRCTGFQMWVYTEIYEFLDFHTELCITHDVRSISEYMLVYSKMSQVVKFSDVVLSTSNSSS